MSQQPKIYTRTGDDGSTSLVGGDRITKSDLRLECYGTIDETNAALGLAVAELLTRDPNLDAYAAPQKLQTLIDQLFLIQNELFIIGSRLACVDASLLANLPKLDSTASSRLESQIDELTLELQPLRNFILPGGTKAAATLHLARTIVRRAERAVVRLSSNEPVEVLILSYINRLGDYFFAAARYANAISNHPEHQWKK